MLVKNVPEKTKMSPDLAQQNWWKLNMVFIHKLLSYLTLAFPNNFQNGKYQQAIRKREKNQTTMEYIPAVWHVGGYTATMAQLWY